MPRLWLVTRARAKLPAQTSDHGREIEHNLSGIEYGMKRFHRAVSLTLLALAHLILVVELFRTNGLYPRLSLAASVLFIWRMSIMKYYTPDTNLVKSGFGGEQTDSNHRLM